MPISSRRAGTYEVMDERGVQRVIQLAKWNVNGEWRGDIVLNIKCNDEGAVVSIHETKSASGVAHSEWTDEGRWDTVTPYTVLQQPLRDTDIKIFTAVQTPMQHRYAKPVQSKADVLICKFDPECPYEMEVVRSVTDGDSKKRVVSTLRRHISNNGKL
eukprot:TRINITY_DN2718_c0_g1_i1.p1 TRINITY_DN2718_c0_g1~~TRINITY_DN2718_c0_g1_i1.p1  ORF type:complete len:158 (+),score=19.80 TRINITY_DN2718_c0_g1_i1:58-531(+)